MSLNKDKTGCRIISDVVVADLAEQVSAYTAWVNSQLRKKNLKIKSLSEDLRDGYMLVHIVEIVSGHKIGCLDTKDCRDNAVKNVQNVFDFMNKKGIRVQHIEVEGVLSGDTKSIMQVILALAAHFKPTSVSKRPPYQRTPSYESRSSQDVRSSQDTRYSQYSQEQRCYSRSCRSSQDGERSSVGSSVPNTPTKSSSSYSYSVNSTPSKPNCRMKSRIRRLSSSSSMDGGLRITDEVTEIKRITEKLQNFLLNDMEQNPSETKEFNKSEENIVLKTRLEQANQMIEKLQKELSDIRSEHRKHISSTNTKFTSKEAELITLKQKCLKQDLFTDKLETEKAELSVQVEQLKKENNNLHLELRNKDEKIENLRRNEISLQNEHDRSLALKEKEVNNLRIQLKNPDQMNYSGGDFINGSSNNNNKFSQLNPSNNKSPNVFRRHPVNSSQPKNKFQTRIIYFIDSDMTPAMTSINKSVGEVTLKDFKELIQITKSDKNSWKNFNFVFKSLDPELGTVKQEIFSDNEVLPGYNGKIVAWIEKAVSV